MYPHGDVVLVVVGVDSSSRGRNGWGSRVGVVGVDLARGRIGKCSRVGVVEQR